MCRSVFYSIPIDRNMPLVLCFITCWRKIYSLNTTELKLCLISLLLTLSLCSCGLIPVSWHSIEQTPAESIAYIRDGVFVSGEYIRSASIAEIDSQAVAQSNNNLIEIGLGKHQVKIYCDEAKGEFNSLELDGKAKILELDAQVQRTYLVRCEPYSHWWIEDLESKSVVAGEKFN
jgi:hypothetical protein